MKKIRKTRRATKLCAMLAVLSRTVVLPTSDSSNGNCHSRRTSTDEQQHPDDDHDLHLPDAEEREVARLEDTRHEQAEEHDARAGC